MRKLIYNELIKIIAKPRTYISFVAISILVGIILFAMKMDGQTYVSFITNSFEQTLIFEGKILNGNLIAFIILQMLIVQIPLLIALVTGDLLSGESAMGTIRFLLTTPYSRTKVLMSKYFAGLIYTFLITFWLSIMSLLLGRLFFGIGDMMVLNSDGLVILNQNDISWRYLGACIVEFLSLSTVTTLSIMLSSFSDNSIGPIVVTMTIIILFTIIGTLDVTVFNSIKPLLFTTHMASWRSFFDDPFPMSQILNSIFVLLTHIFVFLTITIFHFKNKDILS